MQTFTINLLFGVLFSLPPVLWLYNNNTHDVLMGVLFFPILTIILITICVYIFLLLLTKNILKAKVLTAIFCYFFFSYKTFVSYFETTTVKNYFPVGPKTVIFFLFIFCFFICVRYLRIKTTLIKTQNALLILGFILILHPIGTIFYVEKNRAPLNTPIYSHISANPIATSTSPDIYYIIIERYANFKTLKTRFNIQDNSLKEFLTKNSFYIAKDAHPNYPHTALSLTSSLNLRYLTPDKKILQKLSGDQTILFNNMQRSYIFMTLKKLGYTIYHIGDSWEGTEHNEIADYNFNYSPFPAFYRLFLELTPLDALYQKIFFTFHNKTLPYIIEKKEIEWYKIEKLKKIVNDPSKKMIFLHMLVTHEPYVLDKNGVPLSAEKLSKLTHEEKYKNHIMYGNKILISLIKTIQKNKRPYIIIVQADEGPYTNELRKKVDAGNFQWKYTSTDAINSHMSILNAYYFPDKKYKDLRADSSPVNTFRIILNNYFESNLPILKNKYFLNESFDKLYDFRDVTEKIN